MQTKQSTKQDPTSSRELAEFAAAGLETLIQTRPHLYPLLELPESNQRQEQLNKLSNLDKLEFGILMKLRLLKQGLSDLLAAETKNEKQQTPDHYIKEYDKLINGVLIGLIFNEKDFECGLWFWGYEKSLLQLPVSELRDDILKAKGSCAAYEKVHQEQPKQEPNQGELMRTLKQELTKEIIPTLKKQLKEEVSSELRREAEESRQAQEKQIVELRQDFTALRTQELKKLEEALNGLIQANSELQLKRLKLRTDERRNYGIESEYEENVRFTVIAHKYSSFECDFRIMSDEIKRNKTLAEYDTLYLDKEGYYMLRHPKGHIYEGSLFKGDHSNPGLNLEKLPEKISDPVFKSEVLKVTLKRGHAPSKTTMSIPDTKFVKNHPYEGGITSFWSSNSDRRAGVDAVNLRYLFRLLNLPIRGKLSQHSKEYSNERLNVDKATLIRLMGAFIISLAMRFDKDWAEVISPEKNTALRDFLKFAKYGKLNPSQEEIAERERLGKDKLGILSKKLTKVRGLGDKGHEILELSDDRYQSRDKNKSALAFIGKMLAILFSYSELYHKEFATFCHKLYHPDPVSKDYRVPEKELENLSRVKI